MEQALARHFNHDKLTVNEPKRFNDALLHCFTNSSMSEEEKKSTLLLAHKHANILIPIFVNNDSPQSFTEAISNHYKNSSPNINPDRDEHAIQLVMLACQRWLENGSANFDVKNIRALHRSMLYQIGNADQNEDEQLLKGNTFVPTNNMHFIVQEAESFILFVYRTNPSLIRNQLSQVYSIFDAVDKRDKDIVICNQEAADRMLETSIVPGIIIAALLEVPPSPTKCIVIQKYLVARTVKVIQDSRCIKFQNANRIAKNANSLLRLTRHAVCTHLRHTSIDMNRMNQPYSEFDSYAHMLLTKIQQCYAIDVTCQRIRSSREIERATFSHIAKEIDPVSGEVMVNGVYISKDTWSTVIPRTIQNFDNNLLPLFHQNLQNTILKDVLNVKNKLILAGVDSKIIVSNGINHDKTIHIARQIVPLLDNNDMMDIQKKINNLFRYMCGVLLYLSSGAGHGLEVTEIPPFSRFQEVFNSLRFGMRSSKNINHGVDNNSIISHYVSPHLSRYLVIINLVIRPTVEQHNILKWPNKSKAPTEAGIMFREIMRLDENDSRTSKECNKFARDVFTQIMNCIAPRSLAKITTSNENCNQFHHSPEMHAKAYSSQLYFKDSHGNIISSPIMTARSYWSGLGEPQHDHTIVSDIQVDSNDSNLYNHALRRALNNSNVNLTQLQMMACQTVDDFSNTKHCFIYIHAGGGKSSIWNTPLLARALGGYSNAKSIVISPWNSLLVQHTCQSQKYFHSTKLTVQHITSQSPKETLNLMGQFDLLYLSVHAFKELIESHRNVFLCWDVKRIFIDEYHLLFQEIFRHSNSWESLRDLTVMNAKIVCLSATTTPSLIQMTAHYMGISEGNYDIIGNANSYQLPNVAIILKNSRESELIEHVTQHVDERFKAIRDHSRFAIHIITLTIDQAKAISEKLNLLQISATHLTSECSEIERTTALVAWEAAKIKVLVSTFECGIDSSIVKETINVGGCRSVIHAIQSIGRIRPKQQEGINTRCIFWQTDRKYPFMENDAFEEKLSYMKSLHLFDCYHTMSIEYRKSEMSLRNMFHYKRSKLIFEGKDCYRKELFKVLRIQSSNCNMCSVCTSNQSSRDAESARSAIRQRHRDKHFVIDQIRRLTKTCLACGNMSCNGVNCMDNSRNRCFKCLAVSTGNNYHKSNECHANKIDTQQKSCPFCYLSLSSLMEEWTSTRNHMPGKCVFKDRIKRILLFEAQNQNDRGLSAMNLLKACLQNENIWFETMTQNLCKMGIK